jgi:hypothetical protein
MDVPKIQQPFRAQRPKTSRYYSNHKYTLTAELDDASSLLPSAPPSTPRKSRLWWFFMSWIPRTRWTSTFALIALIQACGCFAGYLSSVIIFDPRASNAYPPYMASLQLLPVAFEPCYQLFLGLSAARTRNTIIILGMCLNEVAALVMGVLGLPQVSDYMRANAMDQVLMWKRLANSMNRNTG